MGQGQGRLEAGPDDPRTDRVALPRQRRHVAAPRRGGSALSECVGRRAGCLRAVPDGFGRGAETRPRERPLDGRRGSRSRGRGDGPVAGRAAYGARVGRDRGCLSRAGRAGRGRHSDHEPRRARRRARGAERARGPDAAFPHGRDVPGRRPRARPAGSRLPRVLYQPAG